MLNYIIQIILNKYLYCLSQFENKIYIKDKFKIDLDEKKNILY